MKVILAVGLYCFAAIAHAGSAPARVYLECAMSNGVDDVMWTVTLDEKNSTASYSIPEVGAASKRAAVFTPEKVTFDSIEISRTDLSIRRTVNIRGALKSDLGQCKLAKPPQRKF